MDRSDSSDALGGTVAFAVNGAVVWGGNPAVRLSFTEDAFVIVTMRDSGDSVRII